MTEFTFTKKEPAREASLLCSANGCPIKWSVDNGKLCSYHAFSPHKQWHSITENLRTNGPWKIDRKEEIPTEKYRGDPKGWARRIIDKKNEGGIVSLAALNFARQAL